MQARPAVVLTREHEDNEEIAQALGAAGVSVREVPCASTRLRDPDPAEIESLPAMDGLGTLAFTSRRGVEGWIRWVSGASSVSWPSGIDLGRVLVGAVGRRTAEALEGAGIRASIIAEPPRGETLARMISQRMAPHLVTVLVCGEVRAAGLEEGLAARGRSACTLTVYSNDSPEIPVLEPFPVAAVLVAAPSAARRLLEANPWMRSCTFVAVGATTASALEKAGIEKIEQPGTTRQDWERALLRLAGAEGRNMEGSRG